MCYNFFYLCFKITEYDAEDSESQSSAQQNGTDITNGSCSSSPPVLPAESDCLKIKKLQDLLQSERESHSKFVSALGLKITALEKENSEWKSKCVKILESQSKLKFNINKLSMECARDIHNSIRKNLSHCFSDAQISSLMSGTKIGRYNEEDFIQALALKSVSVKSYRFVVTKWKLPIPSEASLNRWILNMIVEPGHLDVVYRILQGKAKLMEQKDKSCIIIFAEMNLISEETEQSDLEGHTSLLVVMVKSLLARWKLPVFYRYDMSMTKEILFDVISKLESIGFPVFGVVSDLQEAGINLFNALEVTTEQPFFMLPNTNKKIHAIADVPFLIRSIRDELNGLGITLYHNLVDSQCLHELLKNKRKDKDVKESCKITKESLILKGEAKHKTKIAAQLLSNSVSNCIMFLGEKNELESPNWLETAQFIKLVNDWFDVMNSFFCHVEKSKNAFRSNEYQASILSAMIDTMYHTSVNQVHPAFAKGAIISSKSVPNLFFDLKIKHSCAFVYTRKMNLDALHKFFVHVKKMEATNNPSFEAAFKKLMKKFIVNAVGL